MSKMDSQELREWVEEALEVLLTETKTEWGEDLKTEGLLLTRYTESYFKIRKMSLKEFNVDPEPLLKEMERIDGAIDNLILSIDNLPFQVRSNMGWGVWEVLDDEKAEALGIMKRPMEESTFIKSELIELSKKLTRALKKGEQASIRYRKKNWQNPKLIAFMWSVRSSLYMISKNPSTPLELDIPQTIKGRSPWVEFIRTMARLFDVECSNIERNWEYMNDIRVRFSEAQEDKLHNLSD
ncbi:MAG: hypothetical protein ACPG30_07345 [Parvibaculales bacterium]